LCTRNHGSTTEGKCEQSNVVDHDFSFGGLETRSLDRKKVKKSARFGTEFSADQMRNALYQETKTIRKRKKFPFEFLKRRLGLFLSVENRASVAIVYALKPLTVDDKS
jgi:hypothetical protein